MAIKYHFNALKRQVILQKYDETTQQGSKTSGNPL